MDAANAKRDFETARAIYRTAMRRTDLRAEKIVSNRYRFVWLCNPKVASRSMIDALATTASAAHRTGRPGICLGTS